MNNALNKRTSDFLNMIYTSEESSLDATNYAYIKDIRLYYKYFHLASLMHFSFKYTLFSNTFSRLISFDYRSLYALYYPLDESDGLYLYDNVNAGYSITLNTDTWASINASSPVCAPYQTKFNSYCGILNIS